MCCCTLRNVTIEVSGAGWDWDAGVVRGDRVSLDQHTFAEDPGGSVAENPRERERNDNRVKGESKERGTHGESEGTGMVLLTKQRRALFNAETDAEEI